LNEIAFGLWAQRSSSHMSFPRKRESIATAATPPRDIPPII
jgi:hypothetical protein